MSNETMTDARALDFIRVYLAPYSAHGEKDQVVEHIAERLRGEAQAEQQAVACTVRKDTGITVTADRLQHYMGVRLASGTPLYTRPQAALSSTAAPVGVEGADAEQRARELLAAEYERSGMSGAAFCVRSPSAWVTKETGVVLRAIKAALAQQPAAVAPVEVEGLPQPFGYVEPRHDLSGYEVFDEPGPRRAAIWNLHGMQGALAQQAAAPVGVPDGWREFIADCAANRNDVYITNVRCERAIALLAADRGVR